MAIGPSRLRQRQRRPSAAEEPEDKDKLDLRRGQWKRQAVSRFGLVGAWALMFLMFSLLLPGTFPRGSTLAIIFGSQAELLIISLALVLPFVCGEFDLSVAGILGVSSMVVAQLNGIDHWPVGVAVLIGLAIGPVVGLVNAVFIILIGVDSIIVTLGTGTALYGIALGINVQPIGGVAAPLVEGANYDLFGLPMAFYYAIALAALLWYVLERTPLGRHMYFVGAGREVARLAGIQVNGVRWISLVAAGLISSFAGVALAGSLGGADPNLGPTYLLPAFAALFLGATAIKPGRFNPWGTVIAAYFLLTAETGLELMGYSGWVEQVVSGAALVVAVAAARIVARQYERGGRRVAASRSRTA